MKDVSISGNGPTDELLQMVVFQLGGEEFGVEIMKVQEIIRMPEITQIPQSPEFVEGVINLRGRIIVVINLDKRFNLASKEVDAHSRIIVVEIGENVVGMIVDSVNEVLRIPKSSVDPAPELVTSNISREYITGVGKIDGRLLILLDLAKVMDKKEAAEIASLA
ncbi:MAG: purine-binding chemotaxis protein CheW [Methanolobus sp.]|jgi:purine-binding chemotaxis protein CheW|uniref:Chemotaxis signal transduction protein n=1 Tax=Methanolobus tindarius DSM 2278 TaxID=1090322 RepID=W9E020_METTI|nr:MULTISPECIES: chemotaxis protein CheW [Methanolobus]ETA68961.1 chemotaxis signal transduction protein [Methanolobus tindarius DSM 2278]MDK2830280.1 purine-binding chemotaxis protein CheW [Methanolobus sp.]MDK2939448.1 purine-binding chemotaxis protein CheW [Methanolobus sp.]